MLKGLNGPGISALAFVLATVGVFVGPASAEAQTATTSDTAAKPTESASNTASSSIGDIIVTAQRREEKLNDVGISVVAESGQALVSKGITDTAGLAAIVPGLTAAETPFGTLVLTMRGIGFYESSLSGTSPVATYIDEIPLPYTRMTNGTLLDVQRVEILKGPQGTLYGQNSTGGAINFIANKPTDSFHAGFNASIGRFMDTDVQGYVSGPLTDTVRARIAVRSHQSDDWQTSVSRNDTLGAARFLSGRILLDWAPSEALRFELNLNGFRDKSDVQAVQATHFYPNNPAAVQPGELAAVLTPPGNDRLADWTPGRPFHRNNWFYQAALKTTLAVGARADLIAITAYNRYHGDQLLDPDGTSAEAADSSQDGNIENFSQEIRLQGRTGKLSYVVGGNYSHDKIYENNLYIVGEGSQAHSVPGYPFRIARTHSDQKADTYAAFTDLTYAFNERLSLQGGLRYTKQDRSFNGCIGDPGPIGNGQWARLFTFLYATPISLGACTTLNPATGAIGLFYDSLKQDNISWRGAINYKPSADILLYTSVGRGYKSGSFPTVGGAVTTQYSPAVQESLLAYEVGGKFTMLNRAVQINVAVFYYDYRDKQFRGKILDPLFGSIDKLYNIPKSRVKGGEVQIFARPLRALTLNADITYTDSKILSSFLGLTPLATPTNFQGQSFELTPKWAVNAGAIYDAPVSPSVNAFAGLDINYQSSTHGGYGGIPEFNIAPYTLIDVRVGIRGQDDRWKAQFWIRNLTDKYYWTNANYLGEFSYRQTGRPRTFGVTVSGQY